MIYCVEDDNSIRELIIYTLEAAGFEAAGFSNGLLFWEAMSQELPELVMLDIMLPGEDGISILKEIRASGDSKDIPVIMATAKGSEYDTIIGLDAGADDYLVKPFGMMEMVSRVKAVLRRAGKESANALLSYSDILLDRKKHIVSVKNREISLTLKEYEVLVLMIEHPEQVFSREQLLSNVWGIDYMGESRTVDVHIGTLRTKLGEAGKLIRTVRGVGYKLSSKRSDNE